MRHTLALVLGTSLVVVGTKVAVRIIPIDRRLSLAHQIAFASKIPLAR